MDRELLLQVRSVTLRKIPFGGQLASLAADNAQGEIIELGVVHKLVDKSGSWYAYNGEKIGQGKDNAREFLRNNPKIAEEIEGKVRAAVNVPLQQRAKADEPAA